MTGEDSSARMLEMLAGFQLSQAIYVVTKLGVPDQLAECPRDVIELAHRVGTDLSSLRELMHWLAGNGIFAETRPETFTLTPLGATLVSDSADSVREIALAWIETYYEPFCQLLSKFRTGEEATEGVRHQGTPPRAGYRADGKQFTLFNRAMDSFTDSVKLRALDYCDFEGARQVVDIGSGNGIALAQILARWPHLFGVAFDFPDEIAAVNSRLDSWRLGDRLRAVAGDLRTEVPSAADTYILSGILRNWDDPEVVQILRNVRSVAAPHARVIAIEMILPASRNPHFTNISGVRQRHERTSSELQELFEKSGLHYEYSFDTSTPLSILFASVPPPSARER